MKHEEEPVIHDLAKFELSYFFQNEPIHPVLLELVTLMAIISADEDYKIYKETGVWPTIEGDQREADNG